VDVHPVIRTETVSSVDETQELCPREMGRGGVTALIPNPFPSRGRREHVHVSMGEWKVIVLFVPRALLPRSGLLTWNRAGGIGQRAVVRVCHARWVGWFPDDRRRGRFTACPEPPPCQRTSLECEIRTGDLICQEVDCECVRPKVLHWSITLGEGPVPSRSTAGQCNIRFCSTPGYTDCDPSEHRDGIGPPLRSQTFAS
jgi:hypothetical protein